MEKERVKLKKEKEETKKNLRVYDVKMRIIPDEVFFCDVTENKLTFKSCWDVPVNPLIISTAFERESFHESLIKAARGHQGKLFTKAAETLRKRVNDERIVPFIEKSDGIVTFDTIFYEDEKVVFEVSLMIDNWKNIWNTLEEAQ